MYLHVFRWPPLPYPSPPRPSVSHARKEAQALAGDQAGEDIANYLSGQFVSACDLSSALGRLFSAVAQGQIKPKTAATLAYLAQTLVQAIPIAQHEYINAFGSDYWRRTVSSSFAVERSAPKQAALPAQPAASRSEK